MYEHMDAQIVEDDFESDIVVLKQGIPQGGPRSGQLYALYNSDLPDDLRGAGAGAMIGEVNLTCAIYLDDSMIPTPTVEATRGDTGDPGRLRRTLVSAVGTSKVQGLVPQRTRPPGAVAIQRPVDRLGVSLQIPGGTLRPPQGMEPPLRDEEDCRPTRPEGRGSLEDGMPQRTASR